MVAAKDLYASRWQAFRRVVLPLSVPGIFAAIVLTFVPATGDYINAEVLGGPGTTMVGNVIQSKFLVEGDYPEAAALSVVLMVVMLVLAHHLREDARDGRPVDRAGAGLADDGPVDGEEAVDAADPARYTCAVILLLTLPVLVMILYGFNDVPGDRQSARFFGFTLHWYINLFSESGLTEALRNSLWIAPVSALVATVLGTLLGLALGPLPVLGSRRGRLRHLPRDRDPRDPVRRVAPLAVRGDEGPARPAERCWCRTSRSASRSSR